MDTAGRLNFSPATKHAIAAAVSWQCSVPLCKNPALGADDGVVLNGGTACHIYSAAAGGPRGRGGLTDEELADSGNGLWCCAFHGRVIDVKQGSRWPAAQLMMWKRLAEGRVRRAMAVGFAELGWIDRFSLSIDLSPSKQWEVASSLQKNNLLRGFEGAGKSLVLEALSTISSERHGWRVRDFLRYSISVHYETLTREAHAEASCENDGPIVRELNGASVAIAPTDIAVLFLTPDRRNDRSGVARLTDLVAVEPDTLHALAKRISANQRSRMSVALRRDKQMDDDDDASVNDENEYTAYVKLDYHNFELSFDSLSGSEKLRVAIAFLIALAREEAKARPVLLCIDATWSLDDVSFRHELSQLADEPIQLVVVPPRPLSDAEAAQFFSGWNLIDFRSIQELLGARNL